MSALTSLAGRFAATGQSPSPHTAGVHWRERFLRLASEVATWSKDPERQVGCVIVSRDRRQFAVGYNGFPAGVADTPERLGDKELKNALMRHAEANAVDNARFNLYRTSAFVTKFPCSRCMGQLLNAGVAELFSAVPPDDMGGSWAEDQALALQMAGEAGMIVQWEVKP